MRSAHVELTHWKSGNKKSFLVPVPVERVAREGAALVLVVGEEHSASLMLPANNVHIGKRRFGASLALRLRSSQAPIPGIWMCLGQT